MTQPLSKYELENLGLSYNISDKDFATRRYELENQGLSHDISEKYVADRKYELDNQGLSYDISEEDFAKHSSDTPVEVGEKTNEINIVGVPNPLHALPSYTYNISLHVLSPLHYKETLESSQYIPNESVLIGGAGRYASDQRAPAFRDVDFYIHDLKMLSIIGANRHSQNANVINLSFTIIEPNGATLLNRIIDTARFIKEKNGLKNDPNHLDLPYLLEIEFVGYDDNGIPIPARTSPFTKYIPIKIISMKFKVTSKGAEYRCDAIPYNHHALSNTVATVPVNIQVTAETVGDFFLAKPGSDAGDALKQEVDEFNESQREKTEAAKNIKDEDGRADALKEVSAEYKNKIFKASSYSDAINAAFKLIKANRNTQEADSIEFVIDDEIAKSRIDSVEATSSISTTPMTEEGTHSSASPGAIVRNQINININSGTNLLQVIETIVLGSLYIRDEVINPSDPADAARFKKMLEEKKKMNWFRVIPEIVLKDYDPVRNEFGKLYRYHIVKWPITNNLIKYASNGIPDKVQKSYNYIFTGENNDIIDFQLDFDMLYYVSVTMVREQLMKDQLLQKEAETSQNKISPDEGSKDKEEVTLAKVAHDKSKEARPDLHREVPQIANPSATSTSIGSKDPKTAIVYDTRNALMSNSRGDMINVKLKIIGDPHFIKQDDFFYPPHKRSTFIPVPEIDAYVTQNESIVTDSGELYAFLNFKTPKDFSDDTGLLDYDSKYIESPFKGFFKVLTVESNFNNGKFEQTLDLIRLPDQEAKLKEVAESQREENKESETDGTDSTSSGLSNVDGRSNDLSLPPPSNFGPFKLQGASQLPSSIPDEINAGLQSKQLPLNFGTSVPQASMITDINSGLRNTRTSFDINNITQSATQLLEEEDFFKNIERSRHI